MPPESPANNTGKDVAARRAGCGFTVRIPCPGVLLDASKLESSKIWTTRRPDRHPAAGGGKPQCSLHHLEDTERCCRTVRQLSPCCRTVRRLHPHRFRNLRRATGVQILDTGQAACDKLARARVSPHPLPCMHRSARRFFLPPSRITGSDLYPGGRRSLRPGCRSDAPGPPGLRPRSDRPGRLDLAPGWHPGGRPAAAGGRSAAVQYCGRVQLWNNLAAQF